MKKNEINPAPPPTTDAIEILRRRHYEGKPGREAALDAARTDARIARMIYELRQHAGLTQAELARRVGTTASVICRLEADDYEGHSLSMLRRVAAALDQRMEIRFVPLKRPAR